MLIVYLIGRYLYTYKDCLISRTKASLCLTASCLIAFVLNMATSVIRGYSFAPFARDNSVFMLISAVAVFLIFNSITFSSTFINKCSKNIFAVYISESILRNIINIYFPLTSLDGKWYMFVVIPALALLSFALLTIFEWLRKLIFRYPENFAYKCISNCYALIKSKLQKWYFNKKEYPPFYNLGDTLFLSKHLGALQKTLNLTSFSLQLAFQ